MQELLNEISLRLLSSPIWWGLMFTSIIVIFICIKYGSQIIGWFGEHWARESLNQLDNKKYIVLNDIMILVNGKTYQIDHIVLSKYGIFVIETKQDNGYITGSKYDKKWVRHLKNNKNIYYTNPIRQNYGHVKALCELLNISDDKVFNIVCITSKNVKLNIKHDGELTRGYNINKKILSFNNEIIENTDELKNKIVINNIVDKDKRKEHIARINQSKKEYSNDLCPKCGGKLLERTGKYGKFLGCSKYPKCKYTRKM